MAGRAKRPNRARTLFPETRGCVCSPDYSAITGCSRTIIPSPGVAGTETAFANKGHLLSADWNRAVMPINVAEEVGFEPTDEFPRQRFSRPPPSTARPPLRPASLPPAATRAHGVSGSGALRGHNSTGDTGGSLQAGMNRACGALAAHLPEPQGRLDADPDGQPEDAEADERQKQLIVLDKTLHLGAHGGQSGQ